MSEIVCVAELFPCGTKQPFQHHKCCLFLCFCLAGSSAKAGDTAAHTIAAPRAIRRFCKRIFRRIIQILFLIKFLQLVDAVLQIRCYAGTGRQSLNNFFPTVCPICLQIFNGVRHLCYAPATDPASSGPLPDNQPPGGQDRNLF